MNEANIYDFWDAADSMTRDMIKDMDLSLAFFNLPFVIELLNRFFVFVEIPVELKYTDALVCKVRMVAACARRLPGIALR